MRIAIKKKNIITLITFLFLTHGVCYFFSPEDVHNSGSYFKYIKYILILAFILLTITHNFKSKAIYFFSLIPFAGYYYIINSDPDIINYIGYTLPIYFLFSIHHIRLINWKRVILWTILITSAFGYFEVIFLDNHFYMYNRSKSEYRMVSIFLNPNNLGIMITFLTFAYLQFFSRKRFFSWLYFLNCLVIVGLSGSKTGMGVFVLYSLYVVYVAMTNGRSENDLLRTRDLKYLLFTIPLFVLAIVKLITVLDLSKMRKFEWRTLMIRFSDYLDFFSLVKENYVFPWIETTKNIDNIYLHIWGSFGLPGLVSFILFNVFLIFKVRSEKLLVVLLSFLLTGFTTNFVYLWPVGYLYWGVVSFYFGPQHSLTFERLKARILFAGQRQLTHHMEHRL